MASERSSFSRRARVIVRAMRRDLQRVGHAGAVVVALRLQKDLRLVHEPAEGLAVQDAVGIALIAGAHVVLRLRLARGRPLEASENCA